MSTFTNQPGSEGLTHRSSKGRRQLLEAAAVAIGAVTMAALWVARRVRRASEGETR